MKLIKWTSSLLPLYFVSSQAFATCPPIVPCKTTAEASTIAGSNADQELIMFTQNITSTSNDVASAIIDSGQSTAATIQEGVQSMVSANAELSQIKLNQQLKITRAMADREMAHEAELAEAEFKSNVSVLSDNDTKEEFQLIADTLEEYSDLSVPEIVMILQETYDKDPEGKIPIPMMGAEASCGEEAVKEEGKCSRLIKINPGAKLRSLFKDCSDTKRMLIAGKNEHEARVAAVSDSNNKAAEALSNTNPGGAMMQRVQSQLVLSCTPAQYRNKLCATDKSPEDYQLDIVVGNIVPNGDVSAANFAYPSYSSAEGYIEDLDDATKQEIQDQALDREELIENPNQKIVPFVYTYKNANQVKSAMSFIDNLAADDIVPALKPNERKQVKNAEYQSRYLGRVASLNMVRLVLSDSMNMRVGDKMREMIKGGAMRGSDKFEITPDSPANKESVLGASPIDVLTYRVNKQSSNLQLADQNGDSSNTGNSFIAEPASGDAMDKIFDSMILQNELMLKEYMMGEQMLSMDAISLAQKVNSKYMIDKLEKLRRAGGR
tara:strand:- start:705 stop:2354 length:1650 start_codon:yes stop_codon:yes gene_type:complete